MNVRVVIRAAAAAGLAASLAACAHHGPPPPPDTRPPPPPSSNYTPPPPPSDNGVSSQSMGDVPGSVHDFVVSAGDRVYFDLNASTLNDAGRQILDMQAQWLKRYPQVTVRIEGNCDERGTREFNLALGAQRAESVKAYLVSRGVSDGRITTISYGKERPIDQGTGEDAFAHNRNGHTAITAGAVGGVNDGPSGAPSGQ
ncbi:MAG: peptidoglycan-associated lipoprotein Pal [Caulobacteraceae bacterium]